MATIACLPRIELRPRSIEVARFTNGDDLAHHASQRNAERRFVDQMLAVERSLALSAARAHL